MLAILPEPEYGYALGVQLLDALEASYQEIDSSIDLRRDADAKTFTRRLSNGFMTTSSHAGPSLHEAMREYIEWLKVGLLTMPDESAPFARNQFRINSR